MPEVKLAPASSLYFERLLKLSIGGNHYKITDLKNVQRSTTSARSFQSKHNYRPSEISLIVKDQSLYLVVSFKFQRKKTEEQSLVKRKKRKKRKSFKNLLGKISARRKEPFKPLSEKRQVRKYFRNKHTYFVSLLLMRAVVVAQLVD